MSGNTGLSGKHDVFAELATAGNAHLRDEQAAFANFDVVRDLDEVINFRAFADDRRAERAAINRHARADFHVVADEHISNLRHFAMNAAVLHVTETIRTNHRVGMNADALADFCARINRHVRKQIHVVAQFGIVADKIAGLQNRPRAYFHAFADDTMRSDVRARVNLRARCDDRGRMNAGGEFLFGKNSAMALANAMRALGTRIRIFFADLKRLSAMIAVAALCSARAK